MVVIRVLPSLALALVAAARAAEPPGNAPAEAALIEAADVGAAAKAKCAIFGSGKHRRRLRSLSICEI